MSKSRHVSEPLVSYKTLENQNIFLLIEAIKNGIDYSFFEKLAKSIPFSMGEWSAFLHVSERSMQRFKKGKTNFSQVSSERIVEISMLYKYGVEVFGNTEFFNTWLNDRNLAFGKKKPKELLDSTFGISLVKDELTRIEHGILA